ncbi:MAG: hypothetical protein P1V97_29025, partial [Planctomycetota bacterium]|nr:hypothetical protein [Planctomycetota bacterium]
MEEERAPGGKSFVIGCFIGLVVMIGIGIIVLTYGRSVALEKAERTRVMVKSIGETLSAVAKQNKLPLADGLGGDYSGQKALKTAGIELPKSPQYQGLLCDSWKQPYRFRCSEPGRFLFYSFGPNGRDDKGE